MFGQFKKKRELHPVAQHFCELLEEPGWEYVDFGKVQNGDFVVEKEVKVSGFIISRLNAKNAIKSFHECYYPKEYAAILSAFYRVYDPLRRQEAAKKEARLVRAFGLKEGES